MSVEFNVESEKCKVKLKTASAGGVDLGKISVKNFLSGDMLFAVKCRIIGVVGHTIHTCQKLIVKIAKLTFADGYIILNTE